MPLTSASSGISMAEFVAQVRDELEDMPRFRGVQSATGNGVNFVYTVPNAPVYDGYQYGTPFWDIKVNAVQVPLVSRYEDLVADTVYFDYLNGLAVFGTPPPNGQAITFANSTCRWLNRRIERALRDGLGAMFPTVYQWQSAYLSIVVNKYEYQLPDIFHDPRIRILMVEVRELPSVTERFREIKRWRRTSDNTLMIMSSQEFSPTASVRIQYTAPYQDVSELEHQVSELPVLYAKGTLLGAKEGPRARDDQAPVTQQAQANPMGAQRDAGAIYMNQFYKRLGELERPMPVAGMFSTWAR